MIQVQAIDKAFGAKELFARAEMQVGARDRVALVGPNGSGKTTLFDMIAGEQQPDSGSINIAKDVAIGYLKQETDSLRGRPLLQEVMRAGSAVGAAGHRMSILESEIATSTDDGERSTLLEEYGRLQQSFDHMGGYNLEYEAKRILGGLGFVPPDLDRHTETFSGGWLMRIALAKLLLASPDLLMLDEPTNHLDLESVRWLEKFLKDYEGALLLISHDRDFMDGMANKIVEIDAKRLVSYTGDYESFTMQRAMAISQAEAAAKNQARHVAQTQEFIDRFRYKASKAKQVQSRIKSLERLGPIDSPTARKRKMHLAFPPAPRSGRVVMELSSLSFAYDGKSVYESLDLVIERKDKVALVGPNGAGKSTLLKLIAGALVPSGGQRQLGHSVSLGYFAQHQIEALNPANPVLKELETAIPDGAQIKARNLLGRFLFSGDDVDKPVAVLSGGERTRVALAKLLVSRSTCCAWMSQRTTWT